MAKKKSGAMRYFVLREKENGPDTNHVFTGRQPRQAALKAATRGFSNIILRERGKKKLHFYVGSRKTVPAPKNAPSWMPAKIMKSNVKKKGIKHM